MNKTIIDDDTLWRKISKGSHEAYRLLFLRYYDRLHRFITTITGDPLTGEEAVQEVFVYLWEKRATLRISHSVKAYLYTASKHRAFKLLRSKPQSIGNSSEVESAVQDPQTPETVLCFQDLYQDFEGAVDRLPPQAKRVFVLRYFEQAPQREIARQLSISESTVEKHVMNAFRLLRLSLSSHQVK